MNTFLLLTLSVFGGNTPIEDLYLARVDTAASIENRVLIGFAEPNKPSFKIVLINTETKMAQAIDDQRIKAGLPIIVPFGAGFAIISQFGTNFFFLLDKDGHFLERLHPESFSGWEEGMAVKSAYGLANGDVMVNMLSLVANQRLVGILSTQKRAMNIVYQEPVASFSRQWVPGGDAIYCFTMETGQIEQVDRQTFEPIRTIYPGHEPRKRDPAKFKRLAKRRPYISRMGDPIVFGSEISSYFTRDVDRFGEPMKPIREVAMHIDKKGQLHETNMLPLSRVGDRILGFDIEEKSLVLKKLP